MIAQLDGERRCLAVDLPMTGYTPAAADQDFTLPGLARFVADCCDALELTDFDMVANDTGGAITQVFAAGHPERLHTLTSSSPSSAPASCSPRTLRRPVTASRPRPAATAPPWPSRAYGISASASWASPCWPSSAHGPKPGSCSAPP